MTLSMAPGLDNNGTCRATEFTRGGSMPNAAPADRTRLAGAETDVDADTQRAQARKLAVSFGVRMVEATLLHECRNRGLMQ